MRNVALGLSLIFVASNAWAQTAAPAAPPAPPQPQIPGSHVPTGILMELRALENAFDSALRADCAAERCFSKGCVYVEHLVVDKARTSSLPGLGEPSGPGGVAAQEYLTRARCEFTHEKSIPSRDASALVKRLEQKLSKGWLKVSIGHLSLDPVSASLRESPTPPAEKEVIPEPPPPAPPPPLEWSAEVAQRELWLALLPHFSWMVAMVLLTIAALAVIWALRRLGRASLEEQALAAQLTSGGSESVVAVPPAEPAVDRTAEIAFVGEQLEAWKDRIAQAQLEPDDSVVAAVLREWLRAGEFPLLAKAVFMFSERLTKAFPDDGELATRKLEFAEYLRTVDEQRLPSDSEFFRKLNHHAVSSSLLAQADADVYRSLREEFGASGIVHLMSQLHERHAALLFVMSPVDTQHEVAMLMAEQARVGIARQLLASNRIARDETLYVFEVLRAARSGLALPPRPETVVSDRGRETHAAEALSSLLPHIDEGDRKVLFDEALRRTNGVLPHWYENILYADMLLKVPDALHADMLLEVDIRGLAGWYSLQQAGWQKRFVARLPQTLQGALRAAMSFASRSDQLALARRGRGELARALQKQVARGSINLGDVVA